MEFNQLETLGLAFLSGLRVAELVEETKTEEKASSKKQDERAPVIEETEKDVFKEGDKVKLIKLGIATLGFNVGDLCKITRVFNGTGGCGCDFEIYNGTVHGFVYAKQIEKIKEGEKE